MIDQILQIPLDEVLSDMRPLNKGIMASLAAVGQLYPIIAIPGDGASWRVWDGHTRVRAARELAWTHIDVLPADTDWDAERKASAITLAANLRAKNPLAEGRALATLDDDEYAMQVAGLTKAEIRSRRQLLNLLPRLQAQLSNGSLPLTAARKLSRLSHREQEQAICHAATLMEQHNQTRRRAKRTVPTISEVDKGIRAVKARTQPAIPAMAGLMVQKGHARPDPVAVAAQLRKLAAGYDEGKKIVIEKAASFLEEETS